MACVKITGISKKHREHSIFHQELPERSRHMSVTPSSTVVAAFRDRWAAEQAMEALYDAGFSREQMQYVVPGTGSFFEELKSFFTGTPTYHSDLAGSLSEVGLSDEEARYYASEYEQGNTILVVMTAGREQEALNILGRYGAYNARTASPRESEPQAAQPSGGENPDAPLPQEVASEPSAPFPAEVVSGDPTAPFPAEVAGSSPTEPFPEEVASDPTAPFPAEAASSDTTAPFPPDVRAESAAQADEEIAEPVMVEVEGIVATTPPEGQADVYMPSTDEIEEIEEQPGEEVAGAEEVPEVEETGEVGEIEEGEEAPEVEEIAEVVETPEAGEIEEVAEAPEAGEVAEVGEIDEVAETPEAGEVEEVGEIEEVPEEGEVAEMTEAEEVLEEQTGAEASAVEAPQAGATLAGHL